MKNRGMLTADIEIALIKMAVNQGYKGAAVMERPGRFELKLTPKDKVVFDGRKWEAVTDLVDKIRRLVPC
jgi:hypothetical protein